MALKGLVSRRSRASVIYSDNVNTFVAASKWVAKIKKDEKMQEYLIKEQIQWKFNLTRALWWSGQFERNVRLVKQSPFKAIRRATLTKQELEEISLGTQTTQGRQLIYIQDDIQTPVLIANILLYGQPIMIPEEFYIKILQK